MTGEMIRLSHQVEQLEAANEWAAEKARECSAQLAEGRREIAEIQRVLESNKASMEEANALLDRLHALVARR